MTYVQADVIRDLAGNDGRSDWKDSEKTWMQLSGCIYSAWSLFFEQGFMNIFRNIIEFKSDS